MKSKKFSNLPWFHIAARQQQRGCVILSSLVCFCCRVARSRCCLPGAQTCLAGRTGRPPRLALRLAAQATRHAAAPAHLLGLPVMPLVRRAKLPAHLRAARPFRRSGLLGRSGNRIGEESECCIRGSIDFFLFSKHFFLGHYFSVPHRVQNQGQTVALDSKNKDNMQT